MTKTKRPLSFLLAVLMIVSMFAAVPFTAYAALPGGSDPGTGTGTIITAPVTIIETPLTLEAKAASATVTITNPKEGMQYSINGGAKQDVPADGGITLTQGEKLQLYGKGTEITAYGQDSITHITCNAACYIYGNIMSLVDEYNFSTANSVQTYAFHELFCENENLFNHETKDLVLLATSLAECCWA